MISWQGTFCLNEMGWFGERYITFLILRWKCRWEVYHKACTILKGTLIRKNWYGKQSIIFTICNNNDLQKNTKHRMIRVTGKKFFQPIFRKMLQWLFKLSKTNHMHEIFRIIHIDMNIHADMNIFSTMTDFTKSMVIVQGLYIKLFVLFLLRCFGQVLEKSQIPIRCTNAKWHLLTNAKGFKITTV